MKTLDLKGKNAIVTGAGRGIGKEIALTLADAGANVWIADIVPEIAEQTCEEIKKAGRDSGFSIVDVADQKELDKMVDFATEQMGSLDIMVNAAGVFCFDTIDNICSKELERTTSVNLFGIVYGCKAAIRNISKTRGNGSIVNITAATGDEGDAAFPFNYMNKSAVLNFTKSTALTTCAEGIRCNAVCVGLVHTEMWEAILDKSVESNEKADRDKYLSDYIDKMVPLKMAQEPEDIANAVLFCCSDLARYITGHALNVDGGMNMGYKHAKAIKS